MQKARKVFIGHTDGNSSTEVGFFRQSVLERGNWYTGVSNASMSRVARLIDEEKIVISNVYPLSKQLWIVYNPASAKPDLVMATCESCGSEYYI